jgi:hypothetical protein
MFVAVFGIYTSAVYLHCTLNGGEDVNSLAVRTAWRDHKTAYIGFRFISGRNLNRVTGDPLRLLLLFINCDPKETVVRAHI